MTLRSVAVVSAVVLLVTAFFSFPFVAVYGAEEPKKEVCADFDESKGDKKSGDTVTKSPAKGGIEAGKQAITNSKLETTDEVKVKADGTVEVISKCGKEGDVGKVNFCFPGIGGKETCVSITKKKDEWSNELSKIANVEKSLTDAINAERKNYLVEAAKRFLSGEKLPAEYNALLEELAKKDSPGFCSDPGSRCREGAEKALRELSQEKVEQLLGAVLDGDTDAINRGLREAGKSFGIDDATIKRVSDSLREEAYGALETVCKEINESGCGGVAEVMKESIRGFVSSVEDRFNPVIAGSISPERTPSISLDRLGRLAPEKLGTFAASAVHNLCSKLGSNCHVTLDKMFPVIQKESSGRVNVYGDGGLSTSLMQVYQPTALEQVNRYKQIFGDDYVLHKTDIRTLNPDFVAMQSLQMGALVMQTKAEAAGGNIFETFRRYNGSGSRAVGYAATVTAIRDQLLGGRGPAYIRQAYEAAKIAAGSPDTAQFVRIDPTTTGSLANLPGSFGGRTFPDSSFSPLGLSSGGIGNLLKSLLGGGGSSSGSSGGGGSFGGGGSSGSVSNDTSNSSSGSSAPQPLPPITVEQTPVDENAEPVAPSLSLVVHPSTAQKGESVSVIWSAVGVSTTRVCQLSAESTEGSGVIAEGNEGTKVIQVPVNTPLTELRFSLRCVPRDTRIDPEDAQTSVILRIN